MAVQRLLAIVSGKMQEYVALLSSAGAGSSGAIPALDGSGKLDITFMPAGIGAPTASILASEALSAGAYVNIWNNAGTPNVRNADGSTTGKQADGFVLSAVSNGASATVYFSGLNTSVTGQTTGLVFLGTTPGAGAAAGASTAGQTYQQIGVANSATSVDFAPQNPVVRA